MIRALSIIVVFAAILFFVGGGIAIWQGGLAVTSYALVGGIVGSIASIIGLLAFASPRLTDKDVLSVESQLVQRLADATTSLKDYETKISVNKEELQQLQRDRLEVELLVRQASVKVFLEEKLKRLADEIEERVMSDGTLTDWLIEYEKSVERVKEIDGQIASSSRADLIREVIGGLQPSDKKLFVQILGVKVDLSPVLRLSEGLVDGIASGFIR